MELNKPTHFTVNTKAAGKAKLDAQFTGPNKGEAVRDFDILNNHDGTHTVKYTPVQQVSTCLIFQLSMTDDELFTKYNLSFDFLWNLSANCRL